MVRSPASHEIWEQERHAGCPNRGVDVVRARLRGILGENVSEIVRPPGCLTGGRRD
jgi:hypothetical protein